jgi:hypothetical protein
MIPHAVYKVIHVFAVLLLVSALAGVAIHAANGGTRGTSATRRLLTAAHGIGLLLALVAGFGMLARLDRSMIAGWGWVWVKLGIWLVLGGLVMLPYRRPGTARFVFLLVPLLGGLAALMAITKPF